MLFGYRTNEFLDGLVSLGVGVEKGELVVVVVECLAGILQDG